MSSRYQVSETTDPRIAGQVYRLRDVESGAEALVAPSLGQNLYSLRVPVRGATIEAMIDPGEPARGGVGMGNPILFPYPNRVREGRFSYGGRQVHLDVRMGGNSIHGLVASRPWQVVATANRDSAAITSSIASADHAEITRQWPFPFEFTVTYALSGSTVRIDAVATNVGATPMPFGYGIHPYFRLPLAESGRREDCVLTAPASRQWVLDAGLLPTGEIMPVNGDRDFRAGRALGDTTLDDVFTGVATVNGRGATVYRDPAAAAEVVVEADPSFRELVIYAPPGRPLLCIEPYTCTTNAFNLQPEGHDAGLLELGPGASWRGSMWITVRPA